MTVFVIAGMITRDWEFGQNVTDWKLVDVPDLGYYTTDKPFPRGELLIKTKTMIDGYYKHQDVSSSLCQTHLQHLQLMWLPDLSGSWCSSSPFRIFRMLYTDAMLMIFMPALHCISFQLRTWQADKPF